MLKKESVNMLDHLWSKIKFDWWEITNLGIVGYLHFIIDWCKYLLGFSTYRPDFFAYSEIDMDMDFSEDEDTDNN